MADLEVIYDPAKELAAIVHVDDQVGWGPAMIGPNAGQVLQAFIDTATFDVSMLSTYDARTAFRSFLERAGLAAQDQATTTGDVAPEPAGNTGMGSDAALAEAEATAAGTVPAEQPADTDQEQTTAPTHEIVACVNCNGTGTVQMGDPPQSTQCAMCQGTGKIQVPVQA